MVHIKKSLKKIKWSIYFSNSHTDLEIERGKWESFLSFIYPIMRSQNC